MKYIDAEKLKEYLADIYEVWPINDDERHGRHCAIIEIQNFITSLQQEPPEVDLERDAVSYCYDNGINISPRQAKGIARYFWNKGYNARKEEMK